VSYEVRIADVIDYGGNLYRVDEVNSKGGLVRLMLLVRKDDGGYSRQRRACWKRAPHLEEYAEFIEVFKGYGTPSD